MYLILILFKITGRAIFLIQSAKNTLTFMNKISRPSVVPAILGHPLYICIYFPKDLLAPCQSQMYLLVVFIAMSTLYGAETRNALGRAPFARAHLIDPFKSQPFQDVSCMCVTVNLRYRAFYSATLRDLEEVVDFKADASWNVIKGT